MKKVMQSSKKYPGRNSSSKSNVKRSSAKALCLISAASSLFLSTVFCLPAQSQFVGQPNLAPVNLRNDPSVGIPSPTIIPTDVTPIPIGQERELIRPGYRFYLMQKLPRRMWLNATVEASQRFESNVFFTTRDPQRDYVFRALPNVTLGYNILPHTSVYANYFVIKDVFANNGILTNPTTQSVSGGLRHEIPVSNRTNIQLDYQIRELWQAAGLRQADMIPAITATHVFNPKLIGFANIQLQMRSRNIFQGPTREIDPFYTIGLLYRWKQWTFTATDTFVSNYRQSDAIPNQGNLAMIADFEAARPISKKLPGVVAFVRAEPIWNWESNSRPGLSGFDFRLFSGIRVSVSKPSYYAEFNKLRQQLQFNENNTPRPPRKLPTATSPNTPAPGTDPATAPGPGATPAPDPTLNPDPNAIPGTPGSGVPPLVPPILPPNTMNTPGDGSGSITGPVTDASVAPETTASAPIISATPVSTAF